MQLEVEVAVIAKAFAQADDVDGGFQADGVGGVAKAGDEAHGAVVIIRGGLGQGGTTDADAHGAPVGAEAYCGAKSDTRRGDGGATTLDQGLKLRGREAQILRGEGGGALGVRKAGGGKATGHQR